MKFRSVFDVIGPVMIGPSSSHTAGAVRIGQLARKLFGQAPEKVGFHFYGSFARTYRGHATDVAVLAGVMGMETDNPRIPDAFELAKEIGLDYSFVEAAAVPPHPNTVDIDLYAEGQSMTVQGISLGGGMVQITQVSGFSLRLTGEASALLIFHRDAYGAIASITQLLAMARINISHMEVSRADRGSEALMVIETDQPVPPEVIRFMETQQHINKIIKLDV